MQFLALFLSFYSICIITKLFYSKVRTTSQDPARLKDSLPLITHS